MQWDKKQEEWIKKRADARGILTDRAKRAVEIYLQLCLKKIRNYEPVAMANIGAFYLDPLKVNALLLRCFKRYRSGEIDKEEIKKILEKYWPVYVIAKKHAPRTGKIWKRKQREKERLRREAGDSGDIQQVQLQDGSSERAETA